MTAPRRPRRVLHAISEFGAPSETFITDRMVELERLGWEAWVATRWVKRPDAVEFPPAERVFEGRRWVDRPRALLRHGLGAGLRSWWLPRAIASVRPAVIHAHFGWSGLDALEAAREHGVPLIVGLHGYDATVYPQYGHYPPEQPGAHVCSRKVNPLHRRRIAWDAGSPETLYAELFKEARHVLVVSRYLEGRLRELGYSRELAVIPSGIRLDLFTYRGPRPGAGDYRMLFVGRLVEYKGLDVLLRALVSVARRVPEARLEVIGDGPARAENERLAAQLGVASLVTFRGEQPRSGVLQALLRSDVLAVPSRTTAIGQAEGLGNVVKEALAVGVAVAASNSGGIPETLPPEDRLELVGEGDPEALAERLTLLWADRADRADQARRGRRWVEQEFDWRVLAPRIAALYSEAAEG